MINKKQIALIHMAKKDLNLSDEVYRDILYQCANVHSSKDLNPRTFEIVIRTLERLGFRAKQRMTGAQMNKIRAMEKTLGWNGRPTCMAGFARRTCGSEQWQEFSIKQASALISGLIKYQKYHQVTDGR